MLCKEHKSNDMINITKKYCEHTECTRHAQYGYYKNKPLFCNEHKLNGMLHAYYKHCGFDKCLKVPCFGYQMGGQAVYCAKHRLKNMINVKKKHCLYMVNVSKCHIMDTNFLFRFFKTSF